MSYRLTILLAVLAAASATLFAAQLRDRDYGSPSRSYRNSSGRDPFRSGRPRQRTPLRSDFPTWENDPAFERDVFTFVRIQFDSFGSFGWWSRWDNDYPDGDWNFSFRLQQLTALKVASDSKLFRLTDDELLNYPFAYMAGVGKITLSHQEEIAMRRYLLNGGFIMMDDFWTPDAWAHVSNVMRGVFPTSSPGGTVN